MEVRMEAETGERPPEPVSIASGRPPCGGGSQDDRGRRRSELLDDTADVTLRHDGDRPPRIRCAGLGEHGRAAGIHGGGDTLEPEGGRQLTRPSTGNADVWFVQ